MAEKKKKKVDHEALTSQFMRIPRMRTEVARDLLDLGLREVYELQGRAPEVLLEDLDRLRGIPQKERLPWFRLAVYYAENPEPDSALLHPMAWAD